METLTKKKVQHQYSVMYAAYDAKPINDYIRSQDRVSLIDPNKRKGSESRSFDPGENFINNIRYEKACALLASTDWSATKIAQTVGFSNVNYFYVCIKTHTGMALDRYQKIQRKQS
jgi:AraC-like DNA-binding protein